MNDVQHKAELARQALEEAVTEALDRKRRLGQYAVICEGDKVIKIGPDEIAKLLAQGDQ